MLKIKSCIIIASIFILLGMSETYAQELVYKPINPSFIGGNFYNASWLMASAQAQNNISESRASMLDSYKNDPLSDFENSMKRQILNQLTREFIENSFGEQALKEGHYEFGGFQIDISPVTEGINIQIFDSSTGGETTILVPYF